MQMRPVRSRLAISGLTHATFKVAVVWLSDLLSGRLHHEAAAIQFIGKLFFFSMLRRWSSRLGSKGPVQGTNQKITANVQGRMHALGLISLSRSTLLSTISTKRFLDLLSRIWVAWGDGRRSTCCRLHMTVWAGAALRLFLVCCICWFSHWSADAAPFELQLISGGVAHPHPGGRNPLRVV